MSGLALIAIGGNAPSDAGDPRATVSAAIAALRDHFGDLNVSTLYETPAFPAESGADFVNAACTFRSTLSPHDILTVLHQIEADFGRERMFRWGQRTLDLDLIAYDDRVLPDADTHTRWATLSLDDQKLQTPDTLILPHPRVQDRSFVLVPLADVAPDWVHPLLGLSVVDMLANRPATERAEIKPL